MSSLWNIKLTSAGPSAMQMSGVQSGNGKRKKSARELINNSLSLRTLKSAISSILVCFSFLFCILISYFLFYFFYYVVCVCVSVVAALCCEIKSIISPASTFLHHSVRLLSFNLSLSVRFNGHFPGEPGLAGVYWSKGWWWWQLDYWSCKSCKAPVF